MKAIDFDKYLEEQLKRPEFREAYEELEEEYELAKQIIRFRVSRNLTQTQLARLVGTSQPAIARLEGASSTDGFSTKSWIRYTLSTIRLPSITP